MSRVPRNDRVRIAGWLTVAALMLTATPWAALAQAGPNATATQSSTDRSVTFKVTPKSIGLQETRWEFSVVLDTHSADISDDLVQSATLTTNDGRTLKPSNWVETVPGGHHREGVLAFDVAAPRPTTIELRIARPGESTPRTFRWQL